MKSSSLEFCKGNAGAVPTAGYRFGFSGRGAFFTAVRRGLFLGLAVFAIFAVFDFSGIAGPSQAFGQQAGKSASHIELSASTVEEPTRTRATFTAQVAGDSGVSKPTGSVSFMNGEQSIGAAFLDSEGRATLIVDALPAGRQKIAAVYAGDSSFTASNSAPATVMSAASGVPTFTLATSAASLSVVAGETATAVLTATPENGFNQAVTLSCSGAPYVSVTCIFSPSQVVPGAPTATAPNGTPAISTLSIQTLAASGAMLRGAPAAPAFGRDTAYALAFPGILALAGLGLVRKRSAFGKASGVVRMSALLCLLLAGGMGMSSCAQRYRYYHRPPAGNPGTPAGTYTLTISGITGTGSTLTTATVQITLTVKAS